MRFSHTQVKPKEFCVKQMKNLTGGMMTGRPVATEKFYGTVLIQNMNIYSRYKYFVDNFDYWF